MHKQRSLKPSSPQLDQRRDDFSDFSRTAGSPSAYTIYSANVFCLQKSRFFFFFFHEPKRKVGTRCFVSLERSLARESAFLLKFLVTIAEQGRNNDDDDFRAVCKAVSISVVAT